MTFNWADIDPDVPAALDRLDDYNSAPYNGGANPGSLAAGRHISQFPAALDDAATVVSALPEFADLMEGYANDAQASADNASAYAVKLAGTSTTSVLIATGSKVFTTQNAGDKFFHGNYVLVSSGAAASNYMHGLASHVGTTLTVTVDDVGGSGAFNDWNIKLSSPRGSIGVTGATGRAAGYRFLWSTDTNNSDPTTGKIKVNAAPVLATALYISETDADSASLAALFATWDDSTSVIKGRLILIDPVTPANRLIADIIGTITDNGTWDAFALTNVSASGTLTSGLAVSVVFVPKGDKGDTGATGAGYGGTSTSSRGISGSGGKSFDTQAGLAYVGGSRVRVTDAANTANWMEGVVTSYLGTTLVFTADNSSGSGTITSWTISNAGQRGAAGSPGATGSAGGGITIPYTFSTTTPDADPGAGVLRLNQAVQNTATVIRADLLDNLGSDWTGGIDSLDDSTTTGDRGQIRLFKASDLSKYLLFKVTAVGSETGYRNITVVNVGGSAASPFVDTDAIQLTFTRTGNAGAGSGDVVGPASAVDSTFALFNGTTGKLLKDGGAKGALAEKTTIATADIDADAVTYAKMQNVSATDKLLGRSTSGAGDVEEIACTAAGRALIDDADAAAQRTTLGLGNVDNTSDAGKPVSTATQTALDLKPNKNDGAHTGATDVQQAFKRSGFISPPQITTDQNDYNPTGLSTASTLRIDTDAARNMTGLAGGSAGREITFSYIGATSLTLKNASTSSTAASRFQFGSDYVLTPDASVTIKYDNDSQRWRLTDAGNNATTLTGGTLPDARLSTAAKAYGKQSLWVPAGAMVARTTNGAAAGAIETATNKIMHKSLDFDPTTIEYAQFQVGMPKAWNEGTVTFQAFWSHPSTTTNFKASWGLSAVAISDDDAGDAAFGAAQFSNDTGGTTDDIYVSPESSAITIAGTPAAEDLVVFQVQRKADDATNDTLAVDARLIGIRLFLTTDSGNDA